MFFKQFEIIWFAQMYNSGIYPELRQNAQKNCTNEGS